MWPWRSPASAVSKAPSPFPGDNARTPWLGGRTFTRIRSCSGSTIIERLAQNHQLFPRKYWVFLYCCSLGPKGSCSLFLSLLYPRPWPSSVLTFIRQGPTRAESPHPGSCLVHALVAPYTWPRPEMVRVCLWAPCLTRSFCWSREILISTFRHTTGM